MAAALEGIRVLDLTRIGPGPFCTMLLGDMGAEVIWVQPGAAVYVEGRLRPLAATDEAARANSALGRNKQSICLDLRQGPAREVFYKLAAGADVVLEGNRPGVVDRLGIDYGKLSGINPRLVYCSLSGYGQNGPYRSVPGHDVNYIALSGALGLIGDREGRPVLPLNILGDFAGGGLLAAYAIVCALMARERTGPGTVHRLGHDRWRDPADRQRIQPYAAGRRTNPSGRPPARRHQG